jgi:hypothetical protein
MMDVHAAVAGLNFAKAAASSSPTPGLAKFLQPLSSDEAVGLLGALLDHLVWHADSSKAEMKLLEEADTMWTDLLDLIEKLRAGRQALEAGVADPSDPQVAVDAIAAAAGLQNEVVPAMIVWCNQFVAFVQKPELLKYIPAAGQAKDLPAKKWSWSDLIAGRRTAAFRTALLESAAALGSQERAFALGAIGGYATRTCASAYLNGAVGGPRRSHPYRTRLAARSVGAWIRAKHGPQTLSLAGLAGKLRSEVGTTLPASIATIVSKALDAAYGKDLPGKPKPDLAAGYESLLRQLDIVARFTMFGGPAGPGGGTIAPPVSVPADIKATAQGASGGSGSGGANGPGLVPQSPGGGSGSSGGTSGKSYTGKKGGSFWKQLLAVIVTIVLGIIGGVLGGLIGGPAGAGGGAAIGIGLGAAFGEAIGAWEENTPDVVAQSQQALSAPDAAQVCVELWQADAALYQLAQLFLTVLKVGGLAYPEEPELKSPPFAQFMALDDPDGLFRRPIPDPAEFPGPPPTAIEKPTVTGYPYKDGDPPSVFLQPTATGAKSAANLAVLYWKDQAHPPGDYMQRENINLDADRGFHARCWEGKVAPNPVTGKVLAYGAV